MLSSCATTDTSTKTNSFAGGHADFDADLADTKCGGAAMACLMIDVALETSAAHVSGLCSVNLPNVDRQLRHHLCVVAKLIRRQRLPLLPAGFVTPLEEDQARIDRHLETKQAKARD